MNSGQALTGSIEPGSARRPDAGRTSCRWPLGRWAAGPLGRWAAGPLGRWAAGPLGRWAAGPLGRWAAGPLGRWAAGPLGRWAAGPLGRWAAGPLGRWAAGQLYTREAEAPVKSRVTSRSSAPAPGGEDASAVLPDTPSIATDDNPLDIPDMAYSPRRSAPDPDALVFPSHAPAGCAPPAASCREPAAHPPCM